MKNCISCGLRASLLKASGQAPSCILCTFMNALLVSHPCLVSRLGCHIVWQLSAADFKHPCLKPLSVHFIRHPCLTRTVRVRPPSTKKAGLCLFVAVEVGRGVELRSFGSARPCADSVRPPSCIHARPAKCGFSLPPHQKIAPR